jgi:glycosyltransferase involved in cell wall biosynthesis
MTNERGNTVSVIIPAYNEEEAIGPVVEEVRAVFTELGLAFEILVVDDCSTDGTGQIARASDATVLRNVQNGGYGYSLMRGIRAARYPTIAIVDGDGSYPISEFPKLIAEYRRGIAMAIGHRQGAHYVPSLFLRWLRFLFRALVTFIVGRRCPDVNSGMRVFERDAVMPLFPHMSYGFSFTTSITLLFILQALPVSWVPVRYQKRAGRSKINYWRDSLKALQIVASITARLNPIKLFLLAAIVNAIVMLPLVMLGAGAAALPIAATVVIEASALIIALGFVVEGLIDKKPFSKE